MRIATLVVIVAAAALAGAPAALAARQATDGEAQTVALAAGLAGGPECYDVTVSTATEALWARVDEAPGVPGCAPRAARQVFEWTSRGWSRQPLPRSDRWCRDTIPSVPDAVGADLLLCLPRPEVMGVSRSVAAERFARGLDGRLAGRFGDRYRSAEVRRIACPAVQVDTATVAGGAGERHGLCEWEFGSARSRTGGTTTVTFDRTGALVVGSWSSISGVVAQQRCSTNDRYLRVGRWRVVSIRASRWNPGCSGARLLASDALYQTGRRWRDTFRLVSHGTNQAGLPAAQWTCRTGRGRTVRCVNGWRHVFSFVVRSR